MDKVALRKFPYPYEAALTICSDIDGTGFDNFISIHKFLNTDQPTEMGDGLGLPIGNSFWMYDRQERPNSAFSYFENENGEQSKHAPVMRDFIRSGLLDVMHSYGNFERPDEFSRSLAIRAVEELQKHNLNIDVWTNHGGVESVQNLGALSAGHGDLNEKQNPWYHSDVLLNYGIKFYWDSEASLKHAVGQDRPANFSESHWASPVFFGICHKTKSFAKGILNLVDSYYYSKRGKNIVPWLPYANDNTLIFSDTFRDGNLIYKFNRFGHGRYDWSDDLEMLIRKKVLDLLIRHNGYLILYIHIGDRRNIDNPLLLSKGSIAALQNLSALHKAGKIWVHTTSRILNYNLVRSYLDWSFSETEHKYIIKINGLKQGCIFKNLSLENLQGITFVTPGYKDVQILFRDRVIDAATSQPTKFGNAMTVIPIEKPEWPI